MIRLRIRMDKLLVLYAYIYIAQYSSGFITRPTNTADVAGSSNITLECASTYGTNTTNWYFSPLGSSSNQTISNGYILHESYQQQYILNATNFSSILVVRQLSDVTEGNYTCTGYEGSAWALLLVIPLPITMNPSFGPVAGGTKLTIVADYSTIESLVRSVISAIYIPFTPGVSDVYIGKDLSSTNISLQIIDSASLAVQLFAVTPSTTASSIGQSLPIVIEFSPISFNMSINRAFTYKPNPEIKAIYPSQFIDTGGIILDVTGESLSSVANPIIQLKVVITRVSQNSTTSNTSTEYCTVQPGNDTHMQCPMPRLNLPDDFLEILNSRNNTGQLRTKRSMSPIIRFTARSRGLLSRMKRDISVLTLSNGNDWADIYLGFILDGQRKYENINIALPNTKIVFYPAPEIDSSRQLLEFDPDSDELIYIKGQHMSQGCRLSDYIVHIGDQICNNSDLQDNQMSCRPPKEKPSSTLNDTIYCDQHLSIRIDLGYLHYQYACITYAEQSSTKRVALIVGLTVGLAVFAVILAIVIVCVVRFHRKT